MKKILERIKNSKKSTKIVAVVLATAVCVTSVWHNVGEKPLQVNAEETNADKSYLEFVIDRMIGGLQENFTILEIVPHTAYGEFRYYIGDESVNEGLEKNQSLLKTYFGNLGFYVDAQSGLWKGGLGDAYDTPYTITTTFSRFGYEIMLNSETGEFEVWSPKRFLNHVLAKEKEIFEDRIELRTVEANDLTEEDILAADFIIISLGKHDDNTVNCYDAFTGNTTGNYNTYTKSVADDGTVTYTEVTDQNALTYNTYEKIEIEEEDGSVTEKYVSRDLTWENVELLWDNLITGKSIELSDGSVVKTAVPVVMDNKGFDALYKDGNMYKFELIFRMCDAELLEQIRPYISTTYIDEDGDEQQYINCEDLVTGVLSIDKTFTEETSIALNRDDIYKICGGNDRSYDIYRDANPPHSTFLTNDYWVYSGDSCLIPATMTDVYVHATSTDEAGFYDRVGNGATVIDVMRYLLGAPDQLKIKRPKVKILEVQPCTVFDYDEYSEVYALAKRLFLDADGELKDADGNALFDALTESNYNVNGANVCLQVDCIASFGLNGINTDLLAEYDAIILGDNDDLLMKDTSTGKTIDNETALKGYVYRAYGDLIETKTGISVYYPDDYVELTTSKYTANGYSLATAKNGVYYWNPRDLESTSTAFKGWYRYSYKTVYPMSADLFNPIIVNGLTSGKYYVLENTITLAKDAANTAALFADKAGNVRLSSNDITQLKTEELKEYINAGKLLILGEEIYNYTSSSTTIYPTSNIAEVAQYAIDKDANRIKLAKIGSMLVNMKNRNPELTFETLPTEVEHDANGVVNKFNETGLTLKFKFKVRGIANTDYHVRIYIDKNNDGVFYESDDITNDLNEQYFNGDFTTDANGNKNITIESTLSDNFNGLVSYKLVVYEIDENGKELPYRAGITGYTAIQGSEKKDVHVLQILPVPYGNREIHLNMKEDEKFQKALADAGKAIGYNIVFETVYTSQYENWFNPNVTGGMEYDDTSVETIAETNHLAPYDMVVLGFSDLYYGDDISNDYGALDCLDDFIDAGKSVLFTHDTISYSNTVNGMTYSKTTSGKTTKMSLEAHGTNVWGTSLSRMFREKVGMDRYGISSATSEAELKNAPVDKDGNVVYGLQGVTNMLAYRHSVASLSSSSGVSYSTTYGTKTMLFPYITDIDANGDKKVNNTDYASVYDFDGLIDTTKVTKLNDGQVTMYPYTVDDNLTVATTHAQWYQLDLEDPSIVVWYTLTGDDTSNSQYYQDADKDAANNYYIYSKGSITYSGAGHSSMNSEPELKLFVNTVIKAITAGNNVPEVFVVESSYGDGVYNTYVTPYSENYEFTFYGEDLDLLPYVGRFKTAKVTWLNTSSMAPVDINGDGVIDARDDVVYDMGNTLTNLTRVTISIGNGTVFDPYMDIISELIDSGEGARFSIRLTDMYNDVGEVTVVLRKRDLFELD